MPLGLLVAQLEVPPAFEDEFNDWYDTEHIPERLRVPGFLSARRLERVARPRFLNLYDLTDLGVLESAAYLAVSGANKSPWTARVMKHCKSLGRRLYVQTSPGDEVACASHPFTILARYAKPSVVVDHTQLAALRAMDGVSARSFAGREHVDGETFVCATAIDEAHAERVQASFAGLDVGLEVYGAYVRRVT
jgi:hypothetical protein